VDREKVSGDKSHNGGHRHCKASPDGGCVIGVQKATLTSTRGVVVSGEARRANDSVETKILRGGKRQPVYLGGGYMTRDEKGGIEGIGTFTVQKSRCTQKGAVRELAARSEVYEQGTIDPASDRKGKL